MAVSQNGWPVDPARRARTIPGSSVRLTVADGPAGDVLMYVASQFDKRVEDIDLRSSRGEFDDWGYANRPIRGSTSTSNHASATAVDFNATRHPMGVRNTFSAAQRAEIHRILAEVDNVVRWGGDYSGRVDEMHFEINAPYARVATVAGHLAASAPVNPTPPKEVEMSAIPLSLPYSADWNYVALPFESKSNSAVIADGWFTIFAAWGEVEYEIATVGGGLNLVGLIGGNPTAGRLADRQRLAWQVPDGINGIGLRYRARNAKGDATNGRLGYSFPQKEK
ncbi:M15 family metallopeptidase [Amycolatopsis sp. NPDC051061]|uniref:M15 family metallopeptidase n=1 Tax=Amycolatopsis sp. NPDC051061 TaxID=3155042 RepID=UPI0034335C31